MFTPFEAPHGSGLVHFTLSMPAGRSLSDAVFVSNQTAVLVSGPHGERVMHDLADGSFTGKQEGSCSGWAQFMGEIEKIPGCWREGAVDKNEEIGPLLE